MAALPLTLNVCVYVCEMVVKFVEMHLPLGCFVDFLWLRAERNARLSQSCPVQRGQRQLFMPHARCNIVVCGFSNISTLAQCHWYFPIVFCFNISQLCLWPCSIWLSCLRLLWFYILHIQMTSHRMLSFALLRVFSYAFTRNFCGWQLVQNYSSEKVSRLLYSPSSFFPSVVRFSFTLKWKNLWKDKLSSAKVRAEF